MAVGMLVATPRRRAMGVKVAMSVVGGFVIVIAAGLLFKPSLTPETSTTSESGAAVTAPESIGEGGSPAANETVRRSSGSSATSLPTGAGPFESVLEDRPVIDNTLPTQTDVPASEPGQQVQEPDPNDDDPMSDAFVAAQQQAQLALAAAQQSAADAQTEAENQRKGTESQANALLVTIATAADQATIVIGQQVAGLVEIANATMVSTIEAINSAFTNGLAEGQKQADNAGAGAQQTVADAQTEADNASAGAQQTAADAQTEAENQRKGTESQANALLVTIATAADQATIVIGQQVAGLVEIANATMVSTIEAINSALTNGLAEGQKQADNASAGAQQTAADAQTEADNASAGAQQTAADAQTEADNASASAQQSAADAQTQADNAGAGAQQTVADAQKQADNAGAGAQQTVADAQKQADNAGAGAQQTAADAQTDAENQRKDTESQANALIVTIATAADQATIVIGQQVAGLVEIANSTVVSTIDAISSALPTGEDLQEALDQAVADVQEQSRIAKQAADDAILGAQEQVETAANAANQALEDVKGDLETATKTADETAKGALAQVDDLTKALAQAASDALVGPTQQVQETLDQAQSAIGQAEGIVSDSAPRQLPVGAAYVDAQSADGSTFPVVPGVSYEVVTSGIYNYWEGAESKADAECARTNGEAIWKADRFTLPADPSNDPADLYIDNKQVDWTPASGNGTGCNTQGMGIDAVTQLDHEYHYDFVASGTLVNFKINLGFREYAAGGLMVRVFAVPAAPDSSPQSNPTIPGAPSGVDAGAQQTADTLGTPAAEDLVESVVQPVEGQAVAGGEAVVEGPLPSTPQGTLDKMISTFPVLSGAVIPAALLRARRRRRRMGLR